MKHAIAALALAIAGIVPAHAATAYLVSCTSSTSVTGRFIYVGIYQYAGQHFERAFTSYCPYSIEVY